MWQKISSPVYGDVISRLKTECMEPAAEAHYEKLLSDWMKDDDILKEMHGMSIMLSEKLSCLTVQGHCDVNQE